MRYAQIQIILRSIILLLRVCLCHCVRRQRRWCPSYSAIYHRRRWKLFVDAEESITLFKYCILIRLSRRWARDASRQTSLSLPIERIKSIIFRFVFIRLAGYLLKSDLLSHQYQRATEGSFVAELFRKKSFNQISRNFATLRGFHIAEWLCDQPPGWEYSIQSRGQEAR